MKSRRIRRQTTNAYWIIGPVAIIDVSTKKWPYATAMVDAADLTSIVDGGRRWYAYKLPQDHTLYAKRGIEGSENKEFMHRLATPALGELNPDHINRDGLDNRKLNLRAASHSQNALNKKMSSPRGSSSFKGVWRCGSKWRAVATVYGKTKRLGLFANENEAAIAYNEYVKSHGDGYARLNVLLEGLELAMPT
jgi:hypothetical protein